MFTTFIWPLVTLALIIFFWKYFKTKTTILIISFLVWLAGVAILGYQLHVGGQGEVTLIPYIFNVIAAASIGISGASNKFGKVE